MIQETLNVKTLMANDDTMLVEIRDLNIYAIADFFGVLPMYFDKYKPYEVTGNVGRSTDDLYAIAKEKDFHIVSTLIVKLR